MQAPRMRAIPAVLAAVALTAALASAGCGSSGPATNGPLRGGPFGATSPGGADGVDACARSPGMVIYYHDPAGSYVADDHFAMIIAVGRRECGP